VVIFYLRTFNLLDIGVFSLSLSLSLTHTYTHTHTHNFIRYEVPTLKSAFNKMKLDFTRPFVSRMKMIKKKKLDVDETALAIKLTHRSKNPEKSINSSSSENSSSIIGYPFLLGLKTPLTCEGLYREVYARTRHLHEMSSDFSDGFFMNETNNNETNNNMFQLFLSDENGNVSDDVLALPISSTPFRGNTSLNISILWTHRKMWYKSRGGLCVIRRDESSAELLSLPKWLEPCGQVINGLKCPQFHYVLSYRNQKQVLCDKCRHLISPGRRIRGCRVCDWDVCAKCASGMMAKRVKTSPTRSPLLSGLPGGGPMEALPFTNTTLENCFELWGKEESLGDSWRCPDCKIPVRANKRLCLTRLPRILVIQLKRFLYSSGSFNGRLYRMNTVVKIPRKGLDLSLFLTAKDQDEDEEEEEIAEKVQGTSNGDDDEDMADSTSRTPSPFLSLGSAVYDLKGVANHFGGISGGHYTACAYNPEAKGWFCFDDSSVTPCNIDAVLCSPAPYILFYERRV